MPNLLPIRYRQYLTTWNLRLLSELLTFSVIILIFQVLWLSNELFITTRPFLVTISNGIGDLLLRITPSLLNPLLKIDIIRQNNSLVLPDGFYVSYWLHLSGLKQIALTTCIFLIIPGPWLKKLWYIPLNIMLILLLVLVRFIILTTHCTIYPEHYHLLQDLLFGPLFYFEILVMWILWIAVITKSTRLNFRMPGASPEEPKPDQPL